MVVAADNQRSWRVQRGIANDLTCVCFYCHQLQAKLLQGFRGANQVVGFNNRNVIDGSRG